MQHEYGGIRIKTCVEAKLSLDPDPRSVSDQDSRSRVESPYVSLTGVEIRQALKLIALKLVRDHKMFVLAYFNIKGLQDIKKKQIRSWKNLRTINVKNQVSKWSLIFLAHFDPCSPILENSAVTSKQANRAPLIMMRRNAVSRYYKVHYRW